MEKDSDYNLVWKWNGKPLKLIMFEEYRLELIKSYIKKNKGIHFGIDYKQWLSAIDKIMLKKSKDSFELISQDIAKRTEKRLKEHADLFSERIIETFVIIQNDKYKKYYKKPVIA
jgi:hypothetical protein